MRSPKFFRLGTLVLLVLVWVARSAAADAPAWWTSSGVLDTNPANPTDNWAMANVGQLKNIATKAKAHLDSQLNLTATDWNDAYLPAANPLLLFTAGANPENYEPINIGQLKFVASGFYRILKTKAPTYNVPLRLQSLGLTSANYSTLSDGTVVPWSATTGPGENHAAVTIGQLKLAFAFDLTSSGNPNPNLDTDSDGMPDAWEAYFQVSDPNGDSDGDGMTNLAEYLAGRNPRERLDSFALPVGQQLVLRTPANFYGVNVSSWTITTLPNP